MELLCCGYNSMHPADFKIDEVIHGDFGHRFRFLLIKNDCSIKINDNGVGDFKKNTILLVQAGTRVQVLSRAEYYSDDWIEFIADPLEMKGFSVPGDFIISDLSDEDIAELSSDIRRLSIEYSTAPLFFQDFCNAFLKIILIEISRLSNLKVNTSFEKIPHALYNKLLAMRNYTLSNATQEISLSSICKQYSISESHFRRLYKQVFNTTIKNDIIEKRISLAQQYLKNNHELTAVKISELVGYSNYEHFFRQFKAKVGLTPVEYRNRFTKGM